MLEQAREKLGSQGAEVRLQQDVHCLLATADAATLSQLARVMVALAGARRMRPRSTIFAGAEAARWHELSLSLFGRCALSSCGGCAGEPVEDEARDLSDIIAPDTDEWRALTALRLVRDGVDADDIACRLGAPLAVVDTAIGYGELLERFFGADPAGFIDWLGSKAVNIS